MQTKLNLLNQTYQTKPRLLVKAVDAWVRSAFRNVFYILFVVCVSFMLFVCFVPIFFFNECFHHFQHSMFQSSFLCCISSVLRWSYPICIAMHPKKSAHTKTKTSIHTPLPNAQCPSRRHVFCDRASLYLIKVQNMDRQSSEREFKCGSFCVNGGGSVSDWKCGLAGGVCQYRQERRSCRWTSLAPAFTLTFTATPQPLSLASASLVTFTSKLFSF